MNTPQISIVHSAQAPAIEPATPELFANYPDMLTVAQFAEVWGGISKQQAWGMCRRGDVPNVKIGKRVFIPRDMLADFVQKSVGYE